MKHTLTYHDAGHIPPRGLPKASKDAVSPVERLRLEGAMRRNYKASTKAINDYSEYEPMR